MPHSQSHKTSKELNFCYGRTNLDKDGVLISYEEYQPYGTTAFKAGPTSAEVSLNVTAIPARSGMRRVDFTTTMRGTMRRGWGGG